MEKKSSFPQLAVNGVVVLMTAATLKLFLASTAAPESWEINGKCPELAQRTHVLGIPLCERDQPINGPWLTANFPGVTAATLHDLYAVIERQKNLPAPPELVFNQLSDEQRRRALTLVERNGVVKYGELWAILQEGV
jgi:hypothetical protein